MTTTSATGTSQRTSTSYARAGQAELAAELARTKETVQELKRHVAQEQQAAAAAAAASEESKARVEELSLELAAAASASASKVTCSCARG